MKIAVIGVYYASNLGDAVICDCVAFWFNHKYPQAQIDVIDIEGKHEFEKQNTTSMRLLKRRQWNLRRDYWLTRHNIKDCVYYWNSIDVAARQDFYDEIADRKYDAVVFAGGQLFMDWLLLDICEFLKRFQKARIPVYFNACGAGVAVSGTIRKAVQDCLMAENVKLISSRDDVEQITRRYLGVQKKAIPTYDPALWAKEVYQIKAAESDVIGLGIMYSNHASLHKITRFWIRLVKELNARHIKWRMFCNGDMNDYNYGCYVLKKMGLNPKECMIDYPKTPTELVNQIAGFNGIISFRLHSHIIAASLGIPAVAVVWDDKLYFYYRYLKHEERCKTIDDSAENILKALDLAVEERYDMELIQQQKQYARQLLLDAVAQEVGNE